MYPQTNALINRLYEKHFDHNCVPHHLKPALESKYEELSAALRSHLELRLIYNSVLDQFASPSLDQSVRDEVAEVFLGCFSPLDSSGSLIPPSVSALSSQAAHTLRSKVESDLIALDTRIADFATIDQPSTHSMDPVRHLINEKDRLKNSIFSTLSNTFSSLVNCLEKIEEMSTLLSYVWSVLKDLGEERNNQKLTRILSRSRALSSKLKLLKYEYLVDTYDPQAVAGLKVIKNELSELVSSVEGELNHVAVELSKYDNTSQRFKNIVTEYGKLQTKFEELNWTLDQIQHKA
ncbi:hypothetical protein RCL1_008540 [Eukaryota sp. TZLM3-RCL]